MNICSYSNVNPLDVRGLNERFKLLFKEVCYLKANGGGGGGITDLTGDISASGTGSVAATLATVNSNVGTFQNVTVNNKGLVTSATNTYQSYTVFVSQSGTSTQTVSILEDTITGVSLARTAVGTYTFTKTGAFTLNKTVPLDEIFSDVAGNIFRITRTDAGTITLLTYAASDTSVLADNVLSNRYINIKVYN